MPRPARVQASGVCYHVISRGNARSTVFHDAEDYSTFIYLMRRAQKRVPVHIYGYCLMPNHFHMVLRPNAEGDMSAFMHWLLSTHAHREHLEMSRCGHLWQGRYKSFPIEESSYFYTVMRYVERNPVNAGLATTALAWPWSSASVHDFMAPWPILRPKDWREWVDTPHTAKEMQVLRNCMKRGAPYGSTAWVLATAQRLGLEGTLRPQGRPKKRCQASFL